MAVSPTEYFFISDQQGINNLYTYDLSKNLYHQVSNFGSGIKDYDITYDKQYFGFVLPENGRDNLYMEKNYPLEQNIFTAQTKRQQYLSAKFVAQRLKKIREEKDNAATNSNIEKTGAIADDTENVEPDKRLVGEIEIRRQRRIVVDVGNDPVESVVSLIGPIRTDVENRIVLVPVEKIILKLVRNPIARLRHFHLDR